MRIPFHVIKNEVIKQTDINFDIKSKELPFPYIRAIYYVLCKELNAISTYQAIGNSLIHKKTHATVMHSVKNIFPIVVNYEAELYEIYKKTHNNLSKLNYTKKLKSVEVTYVNLKNGVIR